MPELSATPRQWFEVTLSSIGDGVITADVDGNVTFLNPVAEELTGWSGLEARGRSLETVFPIVNEETRAATANPALRAMREGRIFGLANHTVLLTKDGREVPIDDSGAPIRTDRGELLGAVLVFRDISERRRAEAAHALLAAIVDSSEDAIISKRIDGIITSWNAAAERMFEYTAAEAVGQPITIIIPPNRLDEEAMIIRRLRQGERVDHFSTVRTTKSGRPIDISVTVSPVRDKHGNVIGASKIARDITARIRVDEERAALLASERAARQQAEAASRAKDEFVAMISHEIRTPLNAILGWAQMLRRETLSPEATGRALESVERNARAQVQLLSDLLDISRAITGKLRLESHPVDVVTSIEAALESIRPAAEAKSITIDLHRDAARSLVTGDVDRLQQVFWNLLSNAVKFTPKHGHIAVNVHRVNSHVAVAVTDSGVGIRREFLPHVFERFTQADTGSSRTYGGLGLGLAIVRHLVELHGGSVSVSSAGEGMGATFTVELPVRAVTGDTAGADPAVSAVDALAAGITLAGIRIMIVDDERETRELLTTLLTRHGGDVIACASAGEALEKIREWGPSVLVSDIGMPGDDGYAFMRKVRAIPTLQKPVRAIALTAYARPEDRMRALAAGFHMHVPKPVELGELLMVVATLAERPIEA
jgi:PAS domain S-box-containing protein